LDLHLQSIYTKNFQRNPTVDGIYIEQVRRTKSLIEQREWPTTAMMEKKSFRYSFALLFSRFCSLQILYLSNHFPFGQAEPNPWAERAREELTKQLDIPRSRMSFSIAEDRTIGYSEFLANGEFSEDPGSSPKRERERVGSARDWRPADDYESQMKLASFQQEIGLVQPQLSSQVSILNRSESPEAAHLPGEASDNSLSGDNSLFDDLPEDYESPPQEESEDPEAIRTRILQKRTIAGVISTYKSKDELQSALERRAALKFIQQKRGDVDARLRELKAVEERRDEIQEHLDEIDGKVQDLQAESERLFHEDQFAHRDRSVCSCAPSLLFRSCATPMLSRANMTCCAGTVGQD
jgi:hypothetical protein